jgi:hypothetical protein
VEAGNVQVSENSTYLPQAGYGWASGTVSAHDRAEVVAGGAVSPAAIRYTGETITAAQGATVRARAFLPGSNKHLGADSQSIYWSGMVEAAIAATSSQLAITEIHYHPHDPTAEELAANPAFSASDFEFLELKNLGPGPLDLEGYNLSGGVGFTFPNITLPPGECALVVANLNAFQTRYGSEPQRIVGQYSGQLSNGGEELVLRDADATMLIELVYDDEPPWPTQADGFGPSLQLIDPQSTPAAEYSNSDRWRAALPTPGAADVVLAGDMDWDGDVDFDDIRSFVQAMENPAAYEASYGVSGLVAGDFDGDQMIDGDDIQELVAILTQARGE